MLALVLFPTLVALPLEPVDLVLGPRLVEQVLDFLERRCTRGTALTARHDEAKWPVERRNLRIGQCSRDLLR